MCGLMREARTLACERKCVCVYVCVCVCVCARARTRVRMYVCAHVYVCACVRLMDPKALRSAECLPGADGKACGACAYAALGSISGPSRVR